MSHSASKSDQLNPAMVWKVGEGVIPASIYAVKQAARTSEKTNSGAMGEVANRRMIATPNDHDNRAE